MNVSESETLEREIRRINRETGIANLATGSTEKLVNGVAEALYDLCVKTEESEEPEDVLDVYRICTQTLANAIGEGREPEITLVSLDMFNSLPCSRPSKPAVDNGEFTEFAIRYER